MLKQFHVLILTLILIMTLSGCNLHSECGEYTQVDLDEAYDEGYEAGENDGYWNFCDDYEHLDEYEWMLDNIVFTTRTGDCYHAIYCQYAQDREIWVHFVDGAIDAGYRPCSFCIGN
ncbi:MAG: hypothetical protein IKC98_04615 [Firmicutes bacterium]|nr:hypothetical protein [Bacillota bacterium]